MTSKKQILDHASSQTLIEGARSIAAKASRTPEENIAFAWLMGEVVRRHGDTFDKDQYRADVPAFGYVDAALIQLPGWQNTI